MKLLVTGGAGFIGSNFIHHIYRKYKDWRIINLDKLTYAGNLKNLEGLAGERHCFVKGDIADIELVHKIIKKDVDIIVNFAAESHVDRSIDNPAPFIDTNIKGVQVLLEAARQHGIKKFIQVSTDEVYGSLGPTGVFTESSPLAPNSPYSASKASADLLCRAFFKTFQLPVIITRCSNNFGPRQHPEKLIPKAIINALKDKPIPIYGDGLNIRDWIYVEDHCSAIEAVILGGREGEIYNIGGGSEHANLDMVSKILTHVGKPASLIRHIEDRLGHDRRYAVGNSKICCKLGWRPKYKFEEALLETIHWYVLNRQWWEKEGE